MLRQFLIRWLCNGIGLWVAASVLRNVSYDGSAWAIVIAALIFSAVNAFIRPLMIILSLPAIILTLGLFTLVVNAFMLYLVTVLYPSFEVRSFGSAIAAVIIVWLVNYGLNTVLQSEGVPAKHG